MKAPPSPALGPAPAGQLDLFGAADPPLLQVKPLPPVAGLRLETDIIDPRTEATLLRRIDATPWTHEYARRRQHYGVDYRRPSDPAARPLALPGWLDEVIDLLSARRLFRTKPRACLINEYLPGQGIAPHVDRPDAGAIVASLTLGGGCMMDLVPVASDAASEHIWLAPRSVLVLTGTARHQWKHGIARRKADVVAGRRVARRRRVSITFRADD
ncbi:MAG: alpha-ketoglutarate-dependent dioxygenase AlkB [Myxococcota bacterium]